MKTRIHRSRLEPNAKVVLAFQVASGSAPFYISPVILAPLAASGQRVVEVSEQVVEIAPEENKDIPLKVSGSAQAIVRHTANENGEMHRACKLLVEAKKASSVSISLDHLAAIPATAPVEIDVVIQPKSLTGSLSARIERGGIFGINNSNLDHIYNEVGRLSVGRRFSAVVPRDDGLSGRRVVFSFEASEEGLEVDLDVIIRQAADEQKFKASKRPKLSIDLTRLEVTGKVPELFDAAVALSSVGGESGVEDAERFNKETLWALFHRLEPGDMDPHPYFNTSWHYQRLVNNQAPRPSNPAASFEAYLNGDIIADPHPLIDEVYLREQLGEERGDRSGLEAFLASSSLELCPNRLFDTSYVASLMKQRGVVLDGASASTVLRRYLDEPRFWSMPTSPLFNPSSIPHGDGAPLVRYLSDPKLWGASPTPLFDPEYYARQASVPRRRTIAPLAEYLMLEQNLFPRPGPLFDTRYYAMQSDKTWGCGASPLKTYVTSLSGVPHANFDRSSYLANAPAEKIFGLTVDDVVGAGTAFDGPRHILRTDLKQTIVQMTAATPRNPYYRQLPDAFRAAKRDIRHSTNQDDMIAYSAAKKDLVFWWHQLEPFYHDQGSSAATKDKAKRLFQTLTKLKSNGAKLIHTWHNALPYDGRYRDIDYKLLLDAAPLFDLIFVHAERGVPWIKKFAPYANIEVVPHPSLVRHFNTNIDRNVARDILKIPRNTYLVHSFGEMKAYKRIDLIVQAWSHFKQTVHAPDAVLALTGHWKEKTATFEAASSLPDCVFVDQLMSDDRLALWIAASDVCVFAHPQVWASGAVMTALSFGKPTIVPDETGLTEVVQDDQNGFVFKNGDVGSLAEAIQRAREFAYPEHAIFLNRSKAAELHPFRLQPQISQLLEDL